MMGPGSRDERKILSENAISVCSAARTAAAYQYFRRHCYCKDSADYLSCISPKADVKSIYPGARLSERFRYNLSESKQFKLIRQKHLLEIRSLVDCSRFGASKKLPDWLLTARGVAGESASRPRLLLPAPRPEAISTAAGHARHER